MHNSSSRSLRQGFTFIESVIVMGLFAGIMTLVLYFSLDIGQFALHLRQDIQAKQDLQLAVNTMLAEFRSLSPSANGSYPLEAANATSVTFYVDADKNGSIDRVRYFFSTSTLKRGTIRPTTSTPAQYPTSTEQIYTLLPNVTGGSFWFYDSAYTGSQASMTLPIVTQNVRALRFSATIDEQTSTRPVPLTSSFTVTFRNL
jgi:type II secretory pathway pseudopilin PulG